MLMRAGAVIDDQNKDVPSVVDSALQFGDIGKILCLKRFGVEGAEEAAIALLQGSSRNGMAISKEEIARVAQEHCGG